MVLTSEFPHRLALFPLQHLLQAQKTRGTTDRLHLYLLDLDMCPLTHPVTTALRMVVGASSDDFYDFYGVYSNSVVNSALRSMANLCEEYLLHSISSISFRRLRSVSSSRGPSCSVALLPS